MDDADKQQLLDQIEALRKVVEADPESGQPLTFKDQVAGLFERLTGTIERLIENEGRIIGQLEVLSQEVTRLGQEIADLREG